MLGVELAGPSIRSDFHHACNHVQALAPSKAAAAGRPRKPRGKKDSTAPLAGSSGPPRTKTRNLGFALSRFTHVQYCYR